MCKIVHISQWWLTCTKENVVEIAFILAAFCLFLTGHWIMGIVAVLGLAVVIAPR